MHAQRNNLWSALWSGTEGKKPVAPATAANFTASSTNSTADATTGNEFNCPVVFGMDFGTAETGTAYAMRNVGNKSEQPFIGLCAPLGKPVDLDTMCLVNTTTRITEASFVRHKVTTSLLVKEKSVVRGSVETMEVIAFGPEAETEYAALSLERQGNYLLFRQFKMQLLSQHKVLAAVCGRTRAAVTVLTSFFEHLKSSTVAFLRLVSSVNEINPLSDISYVITVPTTWGSGAKATIRTAAANAGMRHIRIVLESEAAAVACHLRAMSELTVASLAVTLSNRQYMRGNSKVLIIDGGAGTLDCTIHNVDVTGGLTETVNDGLNVGSAQIERQYMDSLAQTFGGEFLKHCDDTLPKEMLELRLGLRALKCNIGADEDDEKSTTMFDDGYRVVIPEKLRAAMKLTEFDKTKNKIVMLDVDANPMARLDMAAAAVPANAATTIAPVITTTVGSMTTKLTPNTADGERLGGGDGELVDGTSGVTLCTYTTATMVKDGAKLDEKSTNLTTTPVATLAATKENVAVVTNATSMTASSTALTEWEAVGSPAMTTTSEVRDPNACRMRIIEKSVANATSGWGSWLGIGGVVSDAKNDAQSRTDKRDKRLQYSNGKLIFSKSFAREPIDSIAAVTANHIAQILKQHPNIKTVFAVGGLCSNPIVLDAVRRKVTAFSDSLLADDRFVTPITIVTGGSLEVLKGAVLLGLDPKSIRSRKMRYTYGTDRAVWYDDTTYKHDAHLGCAPFHQTKYAADKKVKVPPLCMDHFKVFIRAGDVVQVGQRFLDAAVPHKTGAVDIGTSLYRFRPKNPNEAAPLRVSCNEKLVDGLELCGTVQIPLHDMVGDLDRRVTIEWDFSDTEICARMILDSDKSVTSTLKIQWDY